MIKQAAKQIGIGIVGAGLIGGKRAQAILAVRGGGKLAAVADINRARADALGAKYGCAVYYDWKKLVALRDIDVEIVATTNNMTARVAVAALRAGKHVLCEKPFGRNVKESRMILRAARQSGRLVKVGFSNRFHPGILMAKKFLDRGVIGKVLFIRARHGHGGRTGMEKEWRLNKHIAGGGELLDQGVHIIDLCRWFGGDFTEADGVTDTKYWKTNVDDNAFAILRSNDVTASMHVSTTNWGNIFSFEVFGKDGYIIVDGLGKRYGVETLRVGKRTPPFNDVKVKEYTFPRDVDDSWEKEWENLLCAVRGKGKLIGDGEDGLRANQIVEAIYRSSESGRVVKLP